jgi:DnaK suppressor protein
MLSNKTVTGHEAISSGSNRARSRQLGQKEIGVLRQQLRDRARALREEIRQGLVKYDEDQYQAIADRVGDFEERSVADLLTDIDLSEIDRDVAELKDVEAALTAVAEGTYGVCIDCEEPIPLERLEKLPSARRCRNCQERFEHADPRPSYKRL